MPIDVTQPDGSVFTALLSGDERCRIVEDIEGYTIQYNEASNRWEYSVLNQSNELVPSGIQVRSKLELPSVPRHLRGRLKAKTSGMPVTNMSIADMNSSLMTLTSLPQFPPDWTPQPAFGERKLLVILVQFSNRSLATQPSAWATEFFDTTPGALSLANFYSENSFDAISITPISHTQAGNPAGVVTVTLSRNHPNLEVASLSGDNPWMNEALTQAAQYVNFGNLDTDGDGILHQNEAVVYFIPVGYEWSGSLKTPCYPGHGGYRSMSQI